MELKPQSSRTRLMTPLALGMHIVVWIVHVFAIPFLGYVHVSNEQLAFSRSPIRYSSL